MKGLVDKGRIADLIYEKAEYCSEDGEELLNDLIRDIDDLPAENMIEYKEGHWIKEGTTMVCDKCGKLKHQLFLFLIGCDVVGILPVIVFIDHGVSLSHVHRAQVFHQSLNVSLC